MRSKRFSFLSSQLVLCGLFFAVALPTPAAEPAVEQRMRRDITFLASDECEGRGPATKGINLAADYIVEQFKKAGLKAGGVDNTYFQPFSMSGPSQLEAPNTLVLKGPRGQSVELRLGKDFQTIGLSGKGKVDAPLVFVGYGAKAKEIGYDDFKDLDVAGKIVVLLRKTPRASNDKVPFDGDRSAQHAALITKLGNANAHNAAAIVFVNDRDSAGNNDPLMDFRSTSGISAGREIPALHIRRDVLDQLLRSSAGLSLPQIEAEIDVTLKPHSVALTGWSAELETSVKKNKYAVKNVVGVVEGSGKLANETIVVGAHYDHLGLGDRGSLARNPQKPAIHYGADDNGSGTTTMMELARRFAAKPAVDRRRLVFMAFSGEEAGLLGSEHYCNNPLFPLEDTAAMVNLDMVGRLRPGTEKDKQPGKDKLTIEGTGTAKHFSELVDKLNEKRGFAITKVTGGMGPSDQASFYKKKIPVLFFFTGEHPDYHKPTDTADKVNVAGMMRIADMAADLIDHLAETPSRPEYVKVASPLSMGRTMAGPRLGIIPSYNETREGVVLGGVAAGGPAEKAGLKEGDVIVELVGKPVKNIETYMALMGTLKKGEPAAVTILRGDKKQTIQVKPE